jgi:hypothetical protein
MAIRKALRFAVIQQRALWLPWIEQIMIQIQDAGIQIQTIEEAPFEQAVRPVYEEQESALVAMIQAIKHVK